MACNGAKKPLLSGLVDSTSPRIDECTPYRRRFRRVKSAPVTELVPSDISGNGPIPRYESFFGGRHQSLKQVAVFLAVYLGLGTLCFYVVRDDIKGKKSNLILDSLYFCIVTMTTVGYGDLVPDSAPVKLLACVFVFTGMLLIGLILSKAADYLVEKQEILLIKALRMHQKLDPAAFLKEIETNKVKYKCYMAIIILSVLMLVGTIFLYMVEDLDIIDAFYCVCSTVTTLGYGDELLNCIWSYVCCILDTDGYYCFRPVISLHCWAIHWKQTEGIGELGSYQKDDPFRFGGSRHRWWWCCWVIYSCYNIPLGFRCKLFPYCLVLSFFCQIRGCSLLYQLASLLAIYVADSLLPSFT